LLVGADPVVYGSGYGLADTFQRQIAIFPHQVNQPLLAEFAKIIFRFGHTIAIGEKEFALAQRDGALLITSVVKQTDYSASALQPAQRSVFSQNDRRQVATVAIGKLTFVTIVDAQEQSGVFFRRRALVKLVIEQRKRREIDPTREMLRRCLDDLDPKEPRADYTRERLGAMAGFFEAVTELHDQMKRLPTGTVRKLLRMGTKMRKKAG